MRPSSTKLSYTPGVLGMLQMCRIVALALPCLLAACSLFGGTKSAAVAQIKVVAEVNANQNNATELDVVFVYDSNVVALLPKTGPDWFSNKAAMVDGLAASIDVVSLQIPPQTLASAELPKRHGKAIGVYVFVNYLSPAGQPMGNITPYKNMTIWLTPTTVLYKSH
jgi:type VI secretion system protein